MLIKKPNRYEKVRDRNDLHFNHVIRLNFNINSIITFNVVCHLNLQLKLEYFVGISIQTSSIVTLGSSNWSTLLLNPPLCFRISLDLSECVEFFQACQTL